MTDELGAYQQLNAMVAKIGAQQMPGLAQMDLAGPAQQTGLMNQPHFTSPPVPEPPPLREQVFAAIDRLGMLEQRVTNMETALNRLCEILLRQVGVNF